MSVSIKYLKESYRLSYCFRVLPKTVNIFLENLELIQVLIFHIFKRNSKVKLQIPHNFVEFEFEQSIVAKILAGDETNHIRSGKA